MIDPVLAPYQYGATLTATLVCVGLYIWSQIQIKSFRETLEVHMQDDVKNFDELKQLTTASINTQQGIAQSISKLADAVQHQTENHAQQLEILREMSSDTKILLTRQTAAQDSLQRLLERVVDKIV